MRQTHSSQPIGIWPSKRGKDSASWSDALHRFENIGPPMYAARDHSSRTSSLLFPLRPNFATSCDNNPMGPQTHCQQQPHDVEVWAPTSVTVSLGAAYNWKNKRQSICSDTLPGLWETKTRRPWGSTTHCLAREYVSLCACCCDY